MHAGFFDLADKFSRTTNRFSVFSGAHLRHNDDRMTCRASRPKIVISNNVNQSSITRDFHNVEITWATPQGCATINNVVIEEHTRRYSQFQGPGKQEDLSES